MADKELTEHQFKFLKSMCDSKVYIIMIPSPIDSDAAEMKEHHATGMKDILDLVEMKFLENITDKFQEMLNEVTKDGGRGFEAYLLSESTVRMFTPGALVN
jgi:hypothetical protein